MSDGVEEAYDDHQRALQEMLEAMNGDTRVGHPEMAMAPYRAELAHIIETMVRDADYKRVRRLLNFMEREERL